MKQEPQLSEDQLFCRSVLSEWVGGDHHLEPIKTHGSGILMPWSQDLSTWDFNGLTHLVLLAHRHHVRFSIRSRGFREVAIVAHRRKTEGGMSVRHPGLDWLLSEVKINMEKK